MIMFYYLLGWPSGKALVFGITRGSNPTTPPNLKLNDVFLSLNYLFALARNFDDIFTYIRMINSSCRKNG